MTQHDTPSHPDLEILRQWISGDLPEFQADTVERHLIACETCAANIDHLTIPEQRLLDKRLRNIRSGSDSIGDRSTDDELSSRERLPDIAPETFDKLTQRWKFESSLARGGVGEIWIANDQMFRRQVAIKVLRRKHASRPRILARFIREAKLTAELAHPGVPCVIELHEEGANSFYVMTFISGQTMLSAITEYQQVRQRDAEAAFPKLIRLLEDFVSVAKTIDYAHSRGIIHRDIKSDNIILGEHGQVTVVDWGGAKRLTEPEDFTDNDLLETETSIDADDHSGPKDQKLDESAVLTQPGSRIGTPAFMAPEQVRGDLDQINERTDVHGLAALLYEIVTGRPPYSASSSQEALNRVLTEDPRSFSQQGVVGLEEIEAICQCGLQKLPNNRYATAAELASAIEAWTFETMRELRAQNERVRLLSLTDDLMMLARRGQGIQWANPAFEKILGWTPEELLGVPHPDLIHPDDLPAIDAMFAELRKTRSTLTDLEPRMRCKDGTYKWISWTATRLPGENLVYFIGRDVDERRRRELETEKIVRAIPEAIVVIDQDGLIVSISDQAWFDLFGRDDSPISAPFVECCVASEDRNRVQETLQHWLTQPLDDDREGSNPTRQHELEFRAIAAPSHGPVRASTDAKAPKSLGTRVNLRAHLICNRDRRFVVAVLDVDKAAN